MIKIQILLRCHWKVQGSQLLSKTISSKMVMTLLVVKAVTVVTTTPPPPISMTALMKATANHYTE